MYIKTVKIDLIAVLMPKHIADIMNSSITVFTYEDIGALLNLRNITDKDSVPRSILPEYRRFKEAILPVLKEKAKECAEIISRIANVRITPRDILEALIRTKIYTDLCIDGIWIFGVTGDITEEKIDESKKAGLIREDEDNGIIYPEKATIVKALGVEMPIDKLPRKLAENIKKGVLRGKGYYNTDYAWIRVELLKNHKDPVVVKIMNTPLVAYGDYFWNFATIKKVLKGEVNKVIFWDM